MISVLQIHPKDNVAVALRPLSRGEFPSPLQFPLLDDIPAGHKIALQDIPAGDKIVKYGNPIGHARKNIRQGMHVHTQNVASDLEGLLEYTYTPSFEDTKPAEEKAFFWGYPRPDGKTGIRNEIWIIPTVGCVNAIAKEIEKKAKLLCTDAPDGIYAYSHPYGCSQLGGDLLHTQKALCGLIRHPNAGGVLVLGLGCENNTLESLKAVLGEYDPRRVKFLLCQDCDDEVSEGAALVQELWEYTKTFRREKRPASELVVGLKCGGSDGFSGITANPVVGGLSDLLASYGGTSILTEVPEMFGAEQLLMNRCRNRQIFEKLCGLINGFKSYFLRYGEKVDENPSPGNKAGGITTLEDKSLGCVQKSGSSPVEDILLYGDPVQQKGLNLLEAPGNDLVASCALAASGAHMVLFTTGRGTPFACPVPTLKISSNTELARKKKQWIDFDAGRLLSENLNMADLSRELFELVLSVASGEKKAKSEELDKSGIAIFKDGITL